MSVRPALIFDCDGVLLDTNTMKCDAFAAAVKAYPASATEPFLRMQAKSFGTSRYVLFDRFFAEFLGRPPEAGEKDRLLDAFTRFAEEGYMTAPETPGMTEVIDRLGARYDLHVASGSDQEELRRVFAARGLDRRFRSVKGSPQSKAKSVGDVVAAHAEVIAMVGDAASDFEAARLHGVPFVFMSGYSTVRAEMTARAAEEGFAMIEDLRELEAVLSRGLTKSEERP